MKRFVCLLLVVVSSACNPGGSTSPPSIVSFTASNTNLPAGGGTITLSWEQANATSLTINQGVGDVSNKTSVSVNVTASTIYELTASNSDGSVNSSATVTVAAACTAYNPTREPFANSPNLLSQGVELPVSRDNYRGFVYPISGGPFTQGLMVQSGATWNYAGLPEPAGLVTYYAGVVTSLNGTLHAFGGGLTTGLGNENLEFVEQAGGSFQSSQITGMPQSSIQAATGHAASSTIALGFISGLSEVGFAEEVLSTGLGPVGGTVLFSGSSVGNANVLAVGYEGDGTAWIIFTSNGTELYLGHRTGNTWVLEAGAQMNGGSAIVANSAIAVASPDGDHALILWSTEAASYDLYATTISIPTAAIASSTLLASSGAATSMAAGYANDSNSANYVFSNMAGQAWVGQVTGTTIGSPTAFHPELNVLQGSLQPLYDACGAALMSYRANPNGVSTPAPVYIDPI